MTSHLGRAGAVWAGIVFAMALAGCAITDQDAQLGPSAVAAFEPNVPHPAVDKTLGPVRATSCYRADGKKAGPALALSRLQARAAALGANAVIDVRYTSVRYPPKSSCWHRIVVRGIAVVLAPQPGESPQGVG